jgi:2-polyprenyl-3-methyl-5-hydroxy-6-metoxy-1,4-benzoquinol methylase
LAATTCRICGGAELTLAYEGFTASPTGEQVAPTRHHPGEQPELHRCGRCGVLQARVIERDLKSAYTRMVDEAYVAEEAARRATGRNLLAAVGAQLDGDDPPSVLDVGCGVGLLLDEARRLGWRAQGVELSDWGVHRARHVGLEVFQGTIEEAGFAPGSFDAVFMIDVLEHLADPVRTLARVSQVLRPGGVLCLVTPNAASAAARVLGSRWWGMLPGHVVLFPHRRLCELLAIMGFGIRSQRPGALRFSLDYWVGSANGYLPGTTLVRRGLRRAGLDRLTVPVNLFDERVVVATKLEAERADAAPTGLVMPLQTAQGTFQAAGVRLLKGFAAWTLLKSQRPDGAVAAARRLTGGTVPGPTPAREYGAARKACLLRAIEHDAAAVVMLQAENDYDPELVARLAEPVLGGQADLVLGSRDLADPELARHMPAWKRMGNRALSALQRRTLGLRVSEFHTGYRAVSPRFLATVPWARAADDLLFDQETMLQAHRLGLRISEVVLPTRYFVRASPVGPVDSVRYGLSTIGLLARDLVDRVGVGRWPLIEPAWHAEVVYRVRDERHRAGQATATTSPRFGPAAAPGVTARASRLQERTRGQQGR